MKNRNPIFEQNYHEYLDQLNFAEVSINSHRLGVTMTNNGKTVQTPFFNNTYEVSKSGIEDFQGKRPDYSTCVILLRYLLMEPKQVSANREWIPFRDFSDAGYGQNAGLSNYAIKKISEFYSDRLGILKKSVNFIGGSSSEENYPYDLCAVIQALPKIPLLFLFNDADEHLPAQALILYERRAECFLDAECRVMVDWSLFDHLKMAERNLKP